MSLETTLWATRKHLNEIKRKPSDWRDEYGRSRYYWIQQLTMGIKFLEEETKNGLTRIYQECNS